MQSIKNSWFRIGSIPAFFGGMTEEVACPSCGEVFGIPVPPPGERPAELDYDCEVCCRPMLLVVDAEGGVEAVGIGS